jgi:hypothetical protein
MIGNQFVYIIYLTSRFYTNNKQIRRETRSYKYIIHVKKLLIQVNEQFMLNRVLQCYNLSATIHWAHRLGQSFKREIADVSSMSFDFENVTY